MPLSWNQLKGSGFDPDGYPACERFGTWETRLDEVAYSRGTRMKAQGKGGRQGIHIYLRSVEDGRKSWLFVMFFPASVPHEQAKNLQAGDCVRVETIHGKNGQAVVKSLEKRTWNRRIEKARSGTGRPAQMGGAGEDRLKRSADWRGTVGMWGKPAPPPMPSAALAKEQIFLAGAL